MRSIRTSMLLALWLWGVASNLAAGALQAPPPQATIQEQLSRLRNDVFTRPELTDASVRDLVNILARDPGLAEAHALLGLAYASRGTQEMQAEAVAELRQALEIEPGLTLARFYLARVYLDLGQVDRAREELLTTIAAVPGQPQFLATLSDAERRLAHPERAADVARQALAVDPSFEQARYYLGLALLDLEQGDDAIRELERVVQSGAKFADVYFSLGSAYLEAGRIDPAIASLTAGVALGPTPPGARIELARAYRMKGQLVSAQTQLDLALPPGAPIQASTVYQRLEADINVEQGLIRVRQGRLEAARLAFMKALDGDPKHGPAHRELAEVYLRQKLYAKASAEAQLAEQCGAPLSSNSRAAIENGLRPVAKGPSK